MKDNSKKYCIVIGVIGISILIAGVILSIICAHIDTSLLKDSKEKEEETFSFAELPEIQKQTDEVIIKESSEEIIELYTITAYCGCEKCCGKWAENRPEDENGTLIVIGASGKRLISGISAASPLPFETKVYLEGYGEVIIQDRPSSYIAERYNDKIIDIYFDSHDDALQFGKRQLQAHILKEEL